MARRLTPSTIVAAFAALGFCATLPLVWPATTFADDPDDVFDEQRGIGWDTTKLGALEASSKLIQDERVKTKWYMEIKVDNLSKEGPESAQFEACVTKAVYSPESRGMPSPAVVWKETESVTVPAGETVVLRRPLPQAIAWGLFQAGQPVASTKSSPVVMRPRPVFATYLAGKDE